MPELLKAPDEPFSPDESVSGTHCVIGAVSEFQFVHVWMLANIREHLGI